MGFTRYWEGYPASVDEGTWTKITEDVVQIYLNTDVMICRSYGENDLPAANTVCIEFNGFAEDAHEDFLVYREPDDPGFDFCKTARKPYDVVVAAVLIVLQHYLPELDVSSDDDGPTREECQEAWRLGLGLVARSLGKNRATVKVWDANEKEQFQLTLPD